MGWGFPLPFVLRIRQFKSLDAFITQKRGIQSRFHCAGIGVARLWGSTAVKQQLQL